MIPRALTRTIYGNFAYEKTDNPTSLALAEDADNPEGSVEH